ncbi:hypothetical protein HGM15179_013223 [Zosterops borbonicus]|uniref:Rna-directed dna polymerase from mobile element jockey-like n=1 Tax=Zosterops borbonicus TaxID=364589 RepID=A0A8K1LH75_9PASS|nr:hypothetical protein HGM15179_013223 [Zosterops borbonicus]
MTQTVRLIADDIKLTDAGGRPEKQDAIQKDLDKLKNWAHGNPMWFNKTKCKVVHLGQGNPQYQHWLWDEQMESNPDKNDLGVLGMRGWT